MVRRATSPLLLGKRARARTRARTGGRRPAVVWARLICSVPLNINSDSLTVNYGVKQN